MKDSRPSVAGGGAKSPRESRGDYLSGPPWEHAAVSRAVPPVCGGSRLLYQDSTKQPRGQSASQSPAAFPRVFLFTPVTGRLASPRGILAVLFRSAGSKGGGNGSGKPRGQK